MKSPREVGVGEHFRFSFDLVPETETDQPISDDRRRKPAKVGVEAEHRSALQQIDETGAEFAFNGVRDLGDDHLAIRADALCEIWRFSDSVEHESAAPAIRMPHAVGRLATESRRQLTQ